MASPLNWFRKNAIYIMVPVGIFCMAFFGLGAVFEQWTSNVRSGSRENPVIATWKHGEFTRDRINEIAQNHFGVIRLLRGIEQVGREESGDEFVQMVTPIAPITNGQQEAVNGQVISRYLMAQKAKDEGLVVSDAMIDDYLSLTAGGAVISTRQMKEINRDVNGGRIPMAAIRRQLETELLNQKMTVLTYSGLPRVPNVTESVEHYGKTERKIDCEVIPVSVVDYVDDSITPTQSEIRKLYDQGKFNFKDPTGEEPGFKLPRRLKMQYFAGNYESFLTKVSADLTDKEIQERYDELVEQESPLVMEIVPDDDMPEINIEEEVEDASEESKEDGESDPAPAPASENSDATPDNSFNVSPQTFQLVSTPLSQEEEAAGQVEAVVTETLAAQVPATETPVTEVPASEGPETEVPETEIPETETPATEVPATETPAVTQEAMPNVETVVPAEPAMTETAPATADATEEKKEAASDQSPATDAAATGGLEAMLKAAQSDDDGSIGPLLGDDEDDKVIKRPKPLKEVESVIRRQLRGAQATQAFREALTTAESAVENYNLQLLQWGDDSSDPKPEAPDFQAIADANGLRLGETELLDNEQLNKTELGGTLNFNPTARTVDRLGDIIFNRFNSLDPYSTGSFSDNTKAFVYWPTELAENEIPKLDQCKEAVIEYWRSQRAFEKAKKAAEAIAAKAGPDKNLTEIEPEKAAPTGEFTWFQARGQRAIFSSPIGVEGPGEEFMSTAFGLERGEAGVAANARRDTIYVIQPISANESVAEYGEKYLKDQLFKFQRIPTDVGLVNAHYFQEKQYEWQQKYQESMDFDYMK